MKLVLSLLQIVAFKVYMSLIRIRGTSTATEWLLSWNGWLILALPQVHDVLPSLKAKEEIARPVEVKLALPSKPPCTTQLLSKHWPLS